MSLIQMYGNYNNDLQKLIANHRELMKLSSAPLIVYKIKNKEQQTSGDDIYNEYTEKQYEKAVELRGFFENPTLAQELVKMGLDMPEQISVFFDTTEMMDTLKRPLEIYDLIQVPHQRNQFYVVMNTYPNPSGERLFKNVQWTVIATKKELSGLNIPPYLTTSDLISWITFGEHFGTEFLSDRQTFLEQRKYRIYGDINYFWEKGNWFGDIEIGNFNGIDNYLDFEDNYNFVDNDVTFSLFLKPKQEIINSTFSIIEKGDEFKIQIKEGKLFVKVNDLESFSVDNFFNNEEWTKLSFSVYYDEEDGYYKIEVYKNENEFVEMTEYVLNGSVNVNNTQSFLIGKGTDVEDYVSGTEFINFYKGYISNLRIYSKRLTEEERINDYQNTITRRFFNY